ncbi:FtsX-like permease family protein [bacterium 1XD42-1]|nr:FtsX-like permease family protein [Oscillospiraceae bacterium]RKJ56050.1 FtsX-like permease family protein [bacterium 1XD42-8]RKJ65765.1 FtsX-like permease family protein [bacterium 1XD42-1]
MYLIENIMLAFNGLRANKMRALLTMLGIIIGIGSVITIVTIGSSITESLSDAFNSMGAKSIQLRITDKPDENGNTDWTRPYEESDCMTDEMLEAYQAAFGNRVEAIMITNSVGWGQAMNGRTETEAFIYGVNEDAVKVEKVDILAGHYINHREAEGEKYVAVISDQFANKLFPNTALHQVLGKEIKIRLSQGMYTFTISGVYHYEIKGVAAAMGGDNSTTIYIPIGVAKRLTDSVGDGYYYVQIKAGESVEDVQAFADQTVEYFNKRFYRNNKYVMTAAQNMDSMIGSMTSMLNTMSMAIGVIAGISLLVGGIGVMNIMLVSVTERTREIGTRKALGAKNSAIRIQFIVESMIICLMGGILGVAMGTGLGRLGSTLLGSPAWPSLGIVLIAAAFSMAIGVFFGYYPANKAAKLNPIEALRYE